MQRYITIAGLVALISASAHAGGLFDGPGGGGDQDIYARSPCYINYVCGTGAAGTPPAADSITSASTFTPAANTCTKDGYVFSHYLATVSDYTRAKDGVALPGVEYAIPGSPSCNYNGTGLTVTLTPQWVAASGTPVASAKTYTDSELATRQPNFTGSATDKLILFSGSTDGAFGERAVVTSLGTPNSTTGLYSGTDLSSTEVPTNSAVNTGVNRKQATVNGTANYVAMYDENAHMTGDAKGIYNASSLTDLDTLVEAGTLNSAIVDAVNSELIQVDESGHESNSGTLWKLNTAANLSLLGPASGSGSGGSGNQSTPSMKNYLLRLGSPVQDDQSFYSIDGSNLYADFTCPDKAGSMVPGDWCAEVYEGCASSSLADVPIEECAGDYDMTGPAVEVSGISACSAVVSNDQGDIPENQLGINDDYTHIATSNPAGRYCYCKLTEANGNTAVSQWVFDTEFENAGQCAEDCASLCSAFFEAEAYYSDYLTNVYNTVP